MENRTRLDWLDELAEKNIVTQKVDLDICSKHGINWDILRTDLIHPICSGNKFFKLKYFLNEALALNKKNIVTYGGPWSNHLIATAFAANYYSLQSFGNIRGEEPQKYSQTLLDCMKLGMKLNFLTREEYDEVKYKDEINDDAVIIPQGGYGLKGMLGAADILDYTQPRTYSHIICAVGSGTMYAGLCLKDFSAAATKNGISPGSGNLDNDSPDTGVMDNDSTNSGVSKDHSPDSVFMESQKIGLVVHNDEHIDNEIRQLLSFSNTSDQTIRLYRDGMGSFAKMNADVLEFMNWFYQKTMIPTDFVYTGRLMKWIYESIISGIFPPGSNILAIHSGGLQGNISLKSKTLLF